MSDTQRLPNLYQLLGLNGLENNRERIAAALKRAQAKADSLKSDSARASDVARLQKVIALGQKYLLSSALKANYDAQWTTNYGGELSTTRPTVASPTIAPELQSVGKSSLPTASIAQTVSSELSWDMAALDALLPEADPLAPFQMADYLRTSQVRDPLAAEADLRKLISLLGGEDLPTAQPTASQPISMQQLSNEYLAEPNGASSALTLPYDEPTHEQRIDTGIILPRSSSSTAAVGLAKRMRQKRQRAMLLGGAGLLAAVGGLVLLGFYLNRPAIPAEQLAQAPKPQPRNSLPAVAKPNGDQANGQADGLQANAAPADGGQVNMPPAQNNPATLTQNPSQLIQPGADVKPMEIQAPQMAKPDMMAPAAMPEKPAEPMKSDAAKPDPAKPDPAKPDPAKPDPAKPEDPAKPVDTKPEMKPETKPDVVVDVKLTDKEKKVWQDEMKRARAGLNKLDPAASENQLAALKPLAKTAAQLAQLATLEQAVGMIRRAREAIVAGIGGLESAETFTVGSSTEVAFIEGDETRIVYRAGGRRQEYKLESVQAGIGLALMKLKPNVIDANLEAAMGVYIMVQPKAPASTVSQGKKLLEDAANLGAISKELSQFYSEDYKLP